MSCFDIEVCRKETVEQPSGQRLPADELRTTFKDDARLHAFSHVQDICHKIESAHSILSFQSITGSCQRDRHRAAPLVNNSVREAFGWQSQTGNARRASSGTHRLSIGSNRCGPALAGVSSRNRRSCQALNARASALDRAASAARSPLLKLSSVHR